jgi:hypothetical protein
MTQPEPESLVDADGSDPAVAAQLASRFRASWARDPGSAFQGDGQSPRFPGLRLGGHGVLGPAPAAALPGVLHARIEECYRRGLAIPHVR